MLWKWLPTRKLTSIWHIFRWPLYDSPRDGRHQTLCRILWS
uniref:Uncharacterized protein n=1 Tax=Arundo donax TaxID=35708 RepID=A0A0A9GFR6_ARUDO